LTTSYIQSFDRPRIWPNSWWRRGSIRTSAFFDSARIFSTLAAVTPCSSATSVPLKTQRMMLSQPSSPSRHRALGSREMVPAG
jgi:hypothetical protein